MSTMMSDDFILEVPDVDSFKMWQGLTGPYFTPYIDEYGILSWTNTGGLVNPAAVSVIGPPGKGLEVKGVVATYADLPQNPQDGDTYLVGTQAPYDGYIWIDGEWIEIGDVSKGEDGKGIVSITKTGTSGLVDEYTILYTEGSPTVYYVTNGKDGVDGQDGQDGVGVPSGGTTEKVLAKASGTDYDTEWVDQSGGGGTVQSVNNVTPDQSGNITLTADDIGTDATNISIQDALDDYVYVGTSAPTDPTTKIWLDTDEPGMSAVSSVNGKTGTVVIDDIPMTLLWTNASPTSSFANQTITLDLSDYDAVLVKSKIVTDINCVFSQLFFKSSGYSYLFFVYTHIFYRFLEISDSGIVFGHCNYLNNYAQSGFSVGDNYAIPLQIYGVKVVA